MNIHKKSKNFIFYITLTISLIASVFVLNFFIKSNPAYADAGWFDYSWSHRKVVNITGSASDLTNYQVKVNVNFISGKMNSDFSDIRFVSSNNVTLLSHWRESYASSSTAEFWVKVPSIPVSGTMIYMYYGNPSANSESNGEATFDFFDKFEPSSSKWTGSGYEHSTAGEGYVHSYKTAPGNVSSDLISNVIGSGGFKAHLKIKSEGSKEYSSCSYEHKLKLISDGGETVLDSSAYSNFVEKSYTISGNNLRLKLYTYAKGCENTVTYRTGWEPGIPWEYCSCHGNNCDGISGDAPGCHAGYSEIDYYCEELSWHDPCCIGGCGAGHGCDGRDCQEFRVCKNPSLSAEAKLWIDDLYVRKYALPEPVASFGTEEEMLCALESESCLSAPCCSSPPAPEPLSCVDNVCKTCTSLICTADNAEDNSISEMGDSIDDVYCTWNIHDGCLVKEGVATVNGCNGIPSYWEPESCGGDAGTSDLWGEKKIYIDDINDYNIKARCGVDDSSTVWINSSDSEISCNVSDDISLMADYNGDGIKDIIVFRNGQWLIDTNRDQIIDISFGYGTIGDKPLMADYNGDGTNDIIVFRNGLWYIDTDRNQSTDINFWFGIAGDIPLMADYDGDGVNDIIAFRNGAWYIDTDRNQSTDIFFWYGIAGDKPIMADYNGDGVNDIIAFRDGAWYIDTDRNQLTDISFWYGCFSDKPIMADYNGDGVNDIIVFRNGFWYIDTDRNQSTDIFFWSWADVVWSWTDVTNKFITGWNTIKFKAIDFCGDDAWGSCGGRWFDLNWDITPRAPALNGNASSFSEIRLTWSDREADTYLLRRYNPDSTITDIDVGSVIVYTDDNEGVDLEANTLYSYQIMAVKNGYSSDWSNTISATTWNQLPVANAGSDQFVILGSSVNLNGSGSNDPDGDPISYDWTFNSIPGASSLTDNNFSDETIVNPSFIPDVIGVYHIDLTVTDSYGGFHTDTVSITVADIKICGDDEIQCPNSSGLCEECDGIDDALCPGECIAPGEIRECLCPQPMPSWKEVHPKME